MESLTFWLRTPEARQNASAAISGLPVGIGLVVEVKEEDRTVDQNAHLHAALQDIASQVVWKGKRYPLKVWKQACVLAFLREIGQRPELIPALDGWGQDIVFYESTAGMSKKKLSALLDYVYAFGTQNGVVFRDSRHAA